MKIYSLDDRGPWNVLGVKYFFLCDVIAGRDVVFSTTDTKKAISELQRTASRYLPEFKFNYRVVSIRPGKQGIMANVVK